MKNKTAIVVAVIILVLLIYLSFIKMNPPLYSSGQSSNKELNPFTIVADIENKGLFDIKLKEILVNADQKTQKVELGVSRSNGLVTISEVRDTSKGVSFHKISDIAIKKPPKSEYDGDFDTIKHYAIVVYHDEDVKNIIIKYSYLGIPFEKEIKFTLSDS